MFNYLKNTQPGPKNKKESFKKRITFENRISESTRIKEKYPNRYPIIVERSPLSLNIEEIDRNKFLVPNDLNFGQFIYVIRQRIKLSPEKSMFFFVNEKIVPINQLMSQIYEENKDKDGFLYLLYSGESTFG